MAQAGLKDMLRHIAKQANDAKAAGDPDFAGRSPEYINADTEYGLSHGMELGPSKARIDALKSAIRGAARQDPKLVDRLKTWESGHSVLPDGDYQLAGIVRGAFTGDPEEFGLEDTEDLKDDPWIAVSRTRGALSRKQLKKFHNAYTGDPDGNGVPFYYMVKAPDGKTRVAFQGDTKLYTPEQAVVKGRKLGIPEAQLDFSTSEVGFAKAANNRALKAMLTGLCKQAAITLDIEKGDTLLGGRFKNVKHVVKDIGTDELGQPTINGMKLLSFRIAKNMKKQATPLTHTQLGRLGLMGGGYGAVGTAGGMWDPADPEHRTFSGVTQGVGAGLGAALGGAGGYNVVSDLHRAGHIKPTGFRAGAASLLIPSVAGLLMAGVGAAGGRGVARTRFKVNEAIDTATGQPTYDERRVAELKKLIRMSLYVIAGTGVAAGAGYGAYKLHGKLKKQAADPALGIPDRSAYGDLSKLPLSKQLTYVLQQHDAQRAGRHADLRFGDAEQGLHSWAVPKARMPVGKEKLLAVRQPTHSHDYAEFTGTIGKGYGAGKVSQLDKGSVEITRVSPKVVSFVVTHHKHPETYALVNTKGKNWIIINTTPQESGALKKHQKLKYAKVDPSKVKDFLNGDYAVSGKIDGAQTLFELFKDRIEATSYRTQAGTKGKPIVHTYRMGLGSLETPKELAGTVLKGEVYGERNGKAIRPQELGGLLNMSTAKSRSTQNKLKTALKAAIFDIQEYKGKPPPPDYDDRLALINQIVPGISPQINVAPTETEPSAATKLFRKIQQGQHPLTSEGIVATPLKGGGVPTKIKFKADADVYIKDVFPAVTQSGKPRAGGFTYSLEPEGPEVGRVGTGFDHATLQDMLANPEDYVGRKARITAQEQFPSGAYRAPAFMALHEDYPAITKGGSVPNDYQKKVGSLSDKMIGKADMDKLAQLTHMYKGVRMFGPRGVNSFREAAYKSVQRFTDRFNSGLSMVSDHVPRNWQLTGPDKEQLMGTLSGRLKHILDAGITNPRVGGTTIIGSNTALIKEPGKGAGRMSIAHEGFHARHPILGFSEDLAYFAGGWGEPRGAGPLRRLLSGVSEVRRYHSPALQEHYRAKRSLKKQAMEKLAVKLLGGKNIPATMAQIRSMYKTIKSTGSGIRLIRGTNVSPGEAGAGTITVRRQPKGFVVDDAAVLAGNRNVPNHPIVTAMHESGHQIFPTSLGYNSGPSVTMRLNQGRKPTPEGHPVREVGTLLNELGANQSAVNLMRSNGVSERSIADYIARRRRGYGSHYLGAHERVQRYVTNSGLGNLSPEDKELVTVFNKGFVGRADPYSPMPSSNLADNQQMRELLKRYGTQ